MLIYLNVKWSLINLGCKKGEISLTDLAQSESSLAGAQANFIKADTEYTSAIAEFERINRIKRPKDFNDNFEIFFNA